MSWDWIDDLFLVSHVIGGLERASAATNPVRYDPYEEDEDDDDFVLPWEDEEFKELFGDDEEEDDLWN